MNTSAISGSTALGSAAGFGPGGLTPDALLLYCASRLNDIDGQIQAQMTSQQSARGAQEKLNAVKRAMLDANQNDPGTKQRIMTALREAHDSLPPGDPARISLNGIFHDYITTASYNGNGTARVADKAVRGDGYNLWSIDPASIKTLATRPGAANGLDANEIKGLQDSVDGVLSDIGKGAELQMIQLQSLISQRQLVIQSTTQMMAKLNESYAVIVQNMK